MLKNQNYRFYIGIDTGVNTGVACWWKEKRQLSSVQCMQIHRAMEYVKEAEKVNPGGVFVRIEDARLRKWIPRQKDQRTEAGLREGAGSVKRDASIWQDFLTDHKIPFELVAPKDNKTKVDAAHFKKLTGFTGSTNNHGRDAAMLVFGL